MDELKNATDAYALWLTGHKRVLALGRLIYNSLTNPDELSARVLFHLEQQANALQPEAK